MRLLLVILAPVALVACNQEPAAVTNNDTAVESAVAAAEDDMANSMNASDGNLTGQGITDHGVTDHGVTDHGVTDH